MSGIEVQYAAHAELSEEVSENIYKTDLIIG